MFQRLFVVGDRALLYASVASKNRSVAGTACRRCQVALATPGAVNNRDYGNSTPPGWSRDESNRHTLLNLVHQGHYEKVLRVWESEKELNRADSALYTVVMAMSEHMKSAELAGEVKDDMERQHLIMEPQCRVHYIKALLSDGGVSEALEFVKSIYHPDMENRKAFLLESIEALQAHGCTEEAVALCDLYDDAGDGGGGRSVALDAIKIECLGELGQSENISLFVKKHYGDVSKCHSTIQTAVANGLASTGELESSLAILKASSHQNPAKVNPKTLALLLECAVQTESHRQGTLIWHHFWEKSTDLTKEEFVDTSSDRSGYLLRAVNAVMHLQALVYKDTSPANQELKAVMEQFVEKDFNSFILEKKLVPNSTTLESALLLSCYNEKARGTVEMVVKSIVRNGQELDPKSFTKWARQSGTLSPFAARKVITQVRMLVHGYSVPLSLSESEDLLGLQQFVHDDQHKYEAAKNIRIIGRIMRSNNLLGHITGWNLLLTGFLRTKALGLMHLTLQDIAESGLKPNLTTYKTLVDGARVINESDTYRRAAYDYWRDFNKESPMLRPDVDFMNKLLYCCRKCRHVERGFYFLDVMEKYDLDPDMDTFREILLICNENNEREKFDAVLEKAYQSLPSEKISLDAFQSECNLNWKSEVDVELATAIITNSVKRKTDDHQE